MVNSKDGVDIAMLFTLAGKPEGSISGVAEESQWMITVSPATPWLSIPPAFATLG